MRCSLFAGLLSVGLLSVALPNVACGPAATGSGADPEPQTVSPPTPPPPDGTPLVVIELAPLMSDLRNGPRRLRPEEVPHSSGFSGNALVPGTEVVVDFSSPAVMNEFQRAHSQAGPMPWLHVRIVSSPHGALKEKSGWVHRDMLGQSAAKSDKPADSASVLRPSLLCSNEQIRQRIRCWQIVQAETSVQVIDCSPRRAHVRYVQRDGRFVHGYVIRSQLSEGACQGAPPTVDPECTPGSGPGGAQRPTIPAGEECKAAPSTAMEVYTSRAYLCDTPEEARTGRACPGGQVLARGDAIRVLGDPLSDGVWRAEVGDGAEAQKGYIAADAVNDYPNIDSVFDYAKSLASVPAAQRLEFGALRYEQLLNSPDKEALQGKVLQARLARSDIHGVQINDDEYSFLVDLGSGRAALRFTFRSEEFTKLVRVKRKTYRCDEMFCDPLHFNARFTGRVYDTQDERGRSLRFPLFEVEGLADRFGFYPADGLAPAPRPGKRSKSRSSP